MKLILIRHGESAKNRGYEIANEENNLTVKGVHQSVSMGESLLVQKFDSIYCSPAPRCVQTLDEILRLRDDNMPIHLTSLVGPKMKNEPYEKLKARVELFLDDLKYDHEKTETVVVISHQAVIGMFLFLLKEDVRKMENGELFEVVL
jgi:broad specificity phosphatase PhoE